MYFFSINLIHFCIDFPVNYITNERKINHKRRKHQLRSKYHKLSFYDFCKLCIDLPVSNQPLNSSKNKSVAFN